MVTTHSPLFLGPDSTTTFTKLRKRSDTSIAAKPFAVAYPIDMADTSTKDQFQIICYEVPVHGMRRKECCETGILDWREVG